jgi:hypothetical protein
MNVGAYIQVTESEIYLLLLWMSKEHEQIIYKNKKNIFKGLFFMPSFPDSGYIWEYGIKKLMKSCVTVGGVCYLVIFIGVLRWLAW